MSDLERAWYALIDAENAERKVKHAYEQAAGEECQYGVTYTGVKHGGHHVEWVEPTEDAEFDKETLQLLVKRWERKGQAPKIVRRRISAPEVVSE